MNGDTSSQQHVDHHNSIHDLSQQETNCRNDCHSIPILCLQRHQFLQQSVLLLKGATDTLELLLSGTEGPLCFTLLSLYFDWVGIPFMTVQVHFTTGRNNDGVTSLNTCWVDSICTFLTNLTYISSIFQFLLTEGANFRGQYFHSLVISCSLFR